MSDTTMAEGLRACAANPWVGFEDMSLVSGGRLRDTAAYIEELERKVNAAVCSICGNDTWNPGEGWLVRRNGVVSVCRSAFHPEGERNITPREEWLRVTANAQEGGLNGDSR